MTDAEYRQALALFRYGLIAEFVPLPANSRGLYARLREKAAHEYSIPGSARTRVAAQTMRHWLSAYRRGGFDALTPKGRSDRGRPQSRQCAFARRLRLHPPIRHSERHRHAPRAGACAPRPHYATGPHCSNRSTNPRDRQSIIAK